MDGFYIGYKPVGISSSKFVLDISKSLNTKAGHTGTLDLEAEGIMIIALGQATKYTQYFNVLPKIYETKGMLGIKTDTQDISGNVIQKIEDVNITCEELKSTIEKFKGKITQIPPIYSAKKINGKKAYKLARKNQVQSIELKPITVNVYSIELLECNIPEFYTKAVVSTGTYIRTLINDIGDTLKVGATTLIIKRTAVGKFGNESVGKIYSIEDGLYFIPSLLLKDDIVRRLKHGKVIKYEAKDGVYKLLSEDGMFHGVVEVKDNVLKALRMQSQEDKNHIDKI
ncbi:tRNA pseudouridine synthase B [Hydrogenobaculum sp. Y04AAS1]|uniref:tRNA pseudouridine(55) synthase TruB n=1 Tax=Hydrogenobaculum sp. (strain Y04AAS1) TaxID=380749 RepID=UPI00017BBDF9|nr:tRNA pseudouridine synthase B [Hydrogenobaculum sp. Y04AAS1]HCT66180.1 tRNA pseudouridine(55) synthase TruB [Hydrogenobaculum sp.]